MADNRRRYEERDPCDLASHPLQNEVICDVDAETRNRLKADIKENGLLQPLEITADGTVIDGHQRLGIALELGLNAVPVLVRDDLKDEAAVERRFLEANFNRRQMTKLEQARVFLRLKQSHRGGLNKAMGDLRDWLAKEFGVSGRTLDRWARLLDTPIEVQRAFEDGKVKLIDAGRVADASPEDQQEIARLIREGGDPKEVVADLAPQRQFKRKRERRVLDRFLSNLERDVGELRSFEGHRLPMPRPEHRKTLRVANKLIVEFLKHLKD